MIETVLLVFLARGHLFSVAVPSPSILVRKKRNKNGLETFLKCLKVWGRDSDAKEMANTKSTEISSINFKTLNKNNDLI